RRQEPPLGSLHEVEDRQPPSRRPEHRERAPAESVATAAGGGCRPPESHPPQTGALPKTRDLQAGTILERRMIQAGSASVQSERRVARVPRGGVDVERWAARSRAAHQLSLPL